MIIGWQMLRLIDDFFFQVFVFIKSVLQMYQSLMANPTNEESPVASFQIFSGCSWLVGPAARMPQLAESSVLKWRRRQFLLPGKNLSWCRSLARSLSRLLTLSLTRWLTRSVDFEIDDRHPVGLSKRFFVVFF